MNAKNLLTLTQASKEIPYSAGTLRFYAVQKMYGFPTPVMNAGPANLYSRAAILSWYKHHKSGRRKPN